VVDVDVDVVSVDDAAGVVAVPVLVVPVDVGVDVGVVLGLVLVLVGDVPLGVVEPGVVDGELEVDVLGAGVVVDDVVGVPVVEVLVELGGFVSSPLD
jgi:hypothetical protein